MKVVVSQSMYFPWVGMLEQIRLADVYVRYDDVQFSKGSFTNRVQIKTPSGVRWLSIPLQKMHLGQKINEIEINENTDWRGNHREILRQAYLKAPFREEMLAVVDQVFSEPTQTLAEVSYASMWSLAKYFGISSTIQIKDSVALEIPGSSTQRVFDVVRSVGGTTYITGHGAWNYLDHELFEKSGIEVQYMQYQRNIYPQLNGPFTPFVTALDLVANCGQSGLQVIKSQTIDWRNFQNESK